MVHLKYYSPVENAHSLWRLSIEAEKISRENGSAVEITAEHCFHIVLQDGFCHKSFEEKYWDHLRWMLSHNPFKQSLTKSPTLDGDVIEVGPRLTFKTAFCTNALSAMSSAGINQITRIEKSTRYQLHCEKLVLTPERLLELLGDRMTECIYDEYVDFTATHAREEHFEIDVLGDPTSLERVNTELGLAFDKNDIDYYMDLFVNKLKRNPTDVELVDLAQSDSEHSRHWFFRGRLVVDGKERSGSLMKQIRETSITSNKNNLIAFHDNSSAIRGFDKIDVLTAEDPTTSSRMIKKEQPRHIIYTAETHNFPTAVCPFQGATTGTGGRIRDVHATGRGAHEIAGVAGYSFGNLHLPGYEQPWEDEKEVYPRGFAHPRQVCIDASNGASDYGNKFGEPVICGFARSFGQRLPNGERVEYMKPIMFSGGLGAIDEIQIKKEPAAAGMLLAKIGGPVYRIGVGGGAASSLSIQGDRESVLDFGAVQRGDAEMEQKLHRVVRACVECETQNPILSIHDQGAGGNGNVLKELCEGAGGLIDANKFELGDETISARELWTAEYQENDAILLDPKRAVVIQKISAREKCAVNIVGEVIDEQRVTVKNFSTSKQTRPPVDLDLKVLGERDKKTFHLTTIPSKLEPLSIPSGITVRQALDLVLRLPSVASKRYLTTKVDRSVTGLVARQQNCGPLHTPLADVAVVALSYFGTITAEHCFHIVLQDGVCHKSFEEKYWDHLRWMLSHNPFKQSLTKAPTLDGDVIEVGPRLTFKTAFCTNALSAMSSAGINQITRIEKSTRYQLHCEKLVLSPERLLELLGDRMTECIYDEHVDFTATHAREEHFEIDVLGDPSSLERVNTELGLAFDKNDIDYYMDLFVNKLKRNPTDVEIVDLAQSDSEHSRHWFFRGRLVIDGKERSGSLMKQIRETALTSNKNNLIAFHDNSSAIRGFDKIDVLTAEDPTTSSRMIKKEQPRHIIYTAETHNFPTAVCPFQGATTGTGGRIRDVHATGRGAHEIAGVAGYSFGNLHLPGYEQPWEDEKEVYPRGFAHPSQVCIDASNGASDYGNKFGEPVICGFARSFGQRLPNGERVEYMKPIMFSGGLGAIDEIQIKKEPASAGMLLAKIGGPVYRIGVGGGAASSLSIQGDRESVLDFGAVQRGDAEMEQKLHRVVRACVECETQNPILSIHDQGAGGNGNVLKELCEGAGGLIDANKFELGDETISARELWTAEYQENDAILLDPKRAGVIQKISAREKCAVNIVGEVIGEQRVTVKNFSTSKQTRPPVDLDLKVLGERDKKTFHLTTVPSKLEPLSIPSGITVRQALDLVLRLPSVASKRYLTTKVDRSVTGLVARQQNCGPLHTPLADVAVVALSYFGKEGAAMAVGEQPIKGLIDPGAMARITLAETLTNLVFAPITDIRDVKMSGNWMWAAKCEGGGAALVQAADALCDALKQTGCAIDGGKDSLSMAAKAAGEVVKAPGTLVLSAYAPCTDITKVVSPDFKTSRVCAESSVVYIRFGSCLAKNRLGGSALAQVFKQVGNDCPDVEDFVKLTAAFGIVQQFIVEDKILAGHDVSDGGFITALLEMAFAGNTQLIAEFNITHDSTIEFLFAEEAGIFVEVEESTVRELTSSLGSIGVETICIGKVQKVFGPDAKIRLAINGETVLDESLIGLRRVWEETSDRLNLLQTERTCVIEEQKTRDMIREIKYKATFEYAIDAAVINNAQHFTSAPRVAVIREEGSNGDREMAAAFHLAGFQTYDFTMTDLLAGHSLDAYRGIAFVGGFSFADVLGSAKGWGAVIRYHPKVLDEMERFRRREDTFSFGVCNGCQLMTLLGWVGEYGGQPSVFLDENKCGRFHSHWTRVKINKSRSIMFQGMEGAELGIWAVHGEGRFTYRTPEVFSSIKRDELIAIQYVNPEGAPTELFPWNPNGSSEGVGGICSEDGRHLAMMPHSDRSFLSWQWPDYPSDWKTNEMNASPWMRMFQNAYNWATKGY